MRKRLTIDRKLVIRITPDILAKLNRILANGRFGRTTSEVVRTGIENLAIDLDGFEAMRRNMPLTALVEEADGEVQVIRKQPEYVIQEKASGKHDTNTALQGEPELPVQGKRKRKDAMSIRTGGNVQLSPTDNHDRGNPAEQPGKSKPKAKRVRKLAGRTGKTRPTRPGRKAAG